MLVLDLAAEEGLTRAAKRSEDGDAQSWTRFEEEEIAFHDRVRQGFLTLAGESPERFSVLDASVPPNTLAEAAIAACKSLWER